jgi:hypothetical protein
VDVAERAAIQGREVPLPPVHGCVCRDDRIDVLHVSRRHFHRKPQIGERHRITWDALGVWLMRATTGTTKDAAGAWSPARYRDDVRRRANLEAAYALVVDVDESGDVDRVADVLGQYQAIVHSTFSSTLRAPRCRIVLLLAESIDAVTYEKTHAVVRAHLRARGIVPDEGAKDASRLSYLPVVRSGAEFRVRVVSGRPLDAARVLAAQRPSPARVPAQAVAPEHGDAYLRGALRRAAETISRASPGERHAAIFREAYALARLLPLREDEIGAALMPAWVGVAGPEREREGERAIRDAVRARRGGS